MPRTFCTPRDWTRRFVPPVTLAFATAWSLAGASTAQGTQPRQFENLATAPGRWSTAFGDLDGNGSIDLFIHVAGRFDARLNDGYGALDTLRSSPTPAAVIGAPLLGDLDGDGDLDVVARDLFRGRIALNRGDATFTTGSTIPPSGTGMFPYGLVDVDGDGDLDLLGRGQLSLWLNDGDANFVDVSATHLPSLVSNDGLAAADIDADGDEDLILVDGDSRGRILRNRGNGVFDAEPPLPVGGDANDVAVADIDADGDLDLFFTRRPTDPARQRDALLLQRPGGGFDVAHDRLPERPATLSSEVRTVDIDDDGDSDLVIAGSNSLDGALILLVNANGTFTDESDVRFDQPRLPFRNLVMADLDRDADVELLVTATTGFLRDDLRLLRNRARHVTATGRSPMFGTSWPLRVFVGPGYATTFRVVLPFVGETGPDVALPIPGTWLLVPTTLIPVAPITIPPGLGYADTAIDVPNEPRLRGLETAVQAVVLDPLPPLGGRVTNVARETIR